MSRALIALLTACVLGACGPQAGPAVEIRNAWAPASPPGSMVAAAYLEIVAAEADTLLAASTPVATSVQMHASFERGGIMQMRPLQSVELVASKPFKFAPGSAHLMLTGLKAPLVPGASFPLTLRLRRGGTRIVEVSVAGPGGPAAG